MTPQLARELRSQGNRGPVGASSKSREGGRLNMDLLSIDVQIARRLAEALAIGMLVGVERYKDRDTGEKRSAGVRTFTILALLGAVCSLLEEPPLALVTFAALAAFLALGYYRGIERRIGLTTEFSGLLVFWLGFLPAGRCRDDARGP